MTTETPAAGLTTRPAAGSNRSLAWMDDALCAQVDPEIWFPETGSAPAARRICGDCPVQEQCRAHVNALETNTYGRRYGTWGGVTGATRRAAAEPVGFNAARDTRILNLAGRGWDAVRIADEVGCEERTVYRVTARAREAGLR